MEEIKRIQMGKNGLTNSFVEQLRGVFNNTKIVKVSILKSACRNKKDAEVMAKELVSKLGPTFSYRLIGYVLTIRRFRKKQER